LALLLITGWCLVYALPEIKGTAPVAGVDGNGAIGQAFYAPDALSATAEPSPKVEMERLVQQIQAAKAAGLVPDAALYNRLAELQPRHGGSPLDQGNDACPATVIGAIPYTDTGTTVGYVNDYTTCGPNTAPDVIYEYTATTTENHTISLCGSAYDTRLEVRSVGACPGTTPNGCNDDFCGPQSQLTLALTAGTTYWIIVDGFSGSSGAYTLNVTGPPPPVPNDVCATALPLAIPGSVSGNTCGATDDYDAVCTYTGSTSPDVVYTFTAASNDLITFTLCGGPTDYDSKLYIYAGSCVNGTEVACNDDACSSPQFANWVSRIACFQLVQGTTYYVVVDGYGVACGNFTLDASICQVCVLTCPPGAALEGEPCPNAPDNFNGGCNSVPEVYSPISCGETVCGTSEAGAGTPGTRDTDWYQLNLITRDSIIWCVTAEFDCQSYILGPGPNGCSDLVVYAGAGLGASCDTVCLSVCLDPGTYWLFVSPQLFDGVPCGDYVATLQCTPCGPQPPFPPFLRIGDWMNPEPWHNWIGGQNEMTRVQLHIFDPLHEIHQVEFDVSMDHLNWIPFYMDLSGYEGIVNTIDFSVVDSGDAWSGYFQHNMIPQVNMPLYFRAIALRETGTLVVENQTNYDPTPPNSVTLNVTDWQIVPGNSITVDIDPVTCNIDCVIYWCTEKPDTFFKGVPGIDQRTHSDNHCVPTAAASCLKYFESQGDSCVAGGLTADELVDALAGAMGTDPASGTNLSAAAGALRDWLNTHCPGGYTVRGPLPYDYEDSRDELERGQDVLSTIDWPGGGRHELTFNSIVNRPLPNGHIIVDFMDPWTGEIEWGEIDPATGVVSGFTGAGAAGTMSENIIICPAESDPGGGGGGGPGPDPGPDPLPIPHPGLWFLHVIIIDLDGHSHRLIRVVDRLMPPIMNLTIYWQTTDNTVLRWSAVPYATSYRIYTAPESIGPWTLLDSTTSTTYTHVHGAVSTRLFYYVTANRP
jgi:hypothetical protein